MDDANPFVVKPLPAAFFEAPESLTEPRWVKKWNQAFERMRSEAEQAGGFTIDMLLAERCATFYTLAIMRDSVGIVPPVPARRTYIDDNGNEVTEEFLVQEGWDHIRNQKEAMQLWTQMVGQLRQNMMPDVAAARMRAYKETSALFMQALKDVAKELPPDYEGLFLPKFYDALGSVDRDALLSLLAEEDEKAKKAVPGVRRRR